MRIRLEQVILRKNGIIGGQETDAPPKWGFSIDVARAWEEPASTHQHLRLARSAKIRHHHEPGSWECLRSPAAPRADAAGRAGRRWQAISLLDSRSGLRAFPALADRPSFAKRPVNLSSPNPLPHTAFMKLLRQAAGFASDYRTPRWQLELGTWMLGTESELILKSRKVLPGKLMKSGSRSSSPSGKQPQRISARARLSPSSRRGCSSSGWCVGDLNQAEAEIGLEVGPFHHPRRRLRPG